MVNGGTVSCPTARSSRSIMRELRKGATKKLEENGGLAGVQLLTVKPRSPTSTNRGESTHTSPVTHRHIRLRRGQESHSKREGSGGIDPSLLEGLCTYE